MRAGPTCLSPEESAVSNEQRGVPAMNRCAAVCAFCAGILLSSVLIGPDPPALASACAPKTAVVKTAPSPREHAADRFIASLLARRPEKFSRVLSDPAHYEVQVLYTQVNRDADNTPSFKQYSYRVDRRSYFNPASLVKLPVLCLSLQKLNELRMPGLDKDTPLSVGKAHSCQTALPKSDRASIGLFIEMVLLASDNGAYNRLYEFLGQQYIHAQLFQKGYPEARVIRRFCGCNYDECRYTNPFVFYGAGGEVVYGQPQLVSSPPLINPLPNLRRGRGYIDSGGRFVPRPFDYTYSNNLCLEDATGMLMRVIFPAAFPARERFGLSPEDYRFLYRYLSMLPGESGMAGYASPEKYPDNFKKYLLFGDPAEAPGGRNGPAAVRSFNIVGKTDGYLSDIAYIVDYDNGIEFFLSAVIYVNSDQVLRDGRYEYDSVGMPFMAALGRTIYDYELGRKKQFKPDLNALKSVH